VYPHVVTVAKSGCATTPATSERIAATSIRIPFTRFRTLIVLRMRFSPQAFTPLHAHPWQEQHKLSHRQGSAPPRPEREGRELPHRSIKQRSTRKSAMGGNGAQKATHLGPLGAEGAASATPTEAAFSSSANTLTGAPAPLIESSLH
jgi:hypothetical protein